MAGVLLTFNSVSTVAKISRKLLCISELARSFIVCCPWFSQAGSGRLGVRIDNQRSASQLDVCMFTGAKTPCAS